MVCESCGRVVKEGAKFCDYCGAAVNASGASEKASGERILGGTKRRGKGLVIGFGVACVAAIVVIAILLGSLFGGARGKVLKAAVKSAGEYAEVLDLFGVSTLGELYKKQAFTQTIRFELEDVSEDMEYYYDIVEGLGMELVVAGDLPGHKIGMRGALSWESVDLVEAYLDMNESKIIVFSPEIMDETAVGIDTKTLGRDLVEADWLEDYIYADLDDFEDIGFNIFDLLDQIREVKPMDSAAQKELLKAIEVEKEGSDEIEVNGEDINCAIYSVVIPEDALLDYLDALQDYMEENNSTEAIVDYVSDIYPDADLDYVFEDMESSYDEMFSSLEEIVEMLGDLEFEVAIKGGYIMAVNGELDVDGDSVEYSLQLGGGKEYVNDISLTVEADGTVITIESTGDHAPKGGVFTDTTTVTVENEWYEENLSFGTEYDTKAKEDNFVFEVDFSDEDMEFSVEGTLTTGNGISLLIDKLVFDDGYGESLTLSGEYSIKPFEKIKVPATETAMLLTMSEDDLEDLVEDIQDNAMDWANDFYTDYYDLYYAMRYWF